MSRMCWLAMSQVLQRVWLLRQEAEEVRPLRQARLQGRGQLPSQRTQERCG